MAILLLPSPHLTPLLGSALVGLKDSFDLMED